MSFEKVWSLDEYVNKLANGEVLPILETKMQTQRKQCTVSFTNRIQATNTELGLPFAFTKAPIP